MLRAPSVVGMNLHTSPAAASPAPAPAPSRRVPVARTLGVSRMFGTGSSVVHAVEGVTVSFERGVLSAVIGPSGSGKTTLMHLLAGLDSPTVGSVELDGVALDGLDDTRLAALRHERTGFVFQSFNLMPALTALENIRLPETLGRRVRRNDRAWEQQLVARLGIAPLLDRRPGELSGGQQQRVAIARALAHRPAVVFADEPTGNLDMRTSGEVLALLSELVTESDCGIVMVTHDPVAASHAGRVVALRDGRIVSDTGARSAAQLAAVMLGSTATAGGSGFADLGATAVER